MSSHIRRGVLHEDGKPFGVNVDIPQGDNPRIVPCEDTSAYTQPELRDRDGMMHVRSKVRNYVVLVVR